jgi:hypothetical protein
MIDPTTGKAPDPNDPEAMARAQPDPNAPPAPPTNVVPFGKKPAPGQQQPPGKKVAGNDDAIDAMATRIRDAQLIDASTPRTLYIYRPVLNWRDIAKHYEDQGIANVYGGPNKKGMKQDMHVTICYSKTPVDWLKVGEDTWGSDAEGKLTVKAGGPRVNEQFGKFLVLAFANSELCWRHTSIRDRADATWEHDDYTPHVSISKDPGAIDPLQIKAWTGPIVFGPEVFEEIEVEGAVYNAPRELATDSLPLTPPPIVVNITLPDTATKKGKVIKTVEHDAQGRVSKVTETPAED